MSDNMQHSPESSDIEKLANESTTISRPGTPPGIKFTGLLKLDASARSRFRPTLERNQSSFSLAVSQNSSNANLNIPDNLFSSNLSTPAKQRIKQDIKLVQQVQSECSSLSVSRISTPLLTPLPLPNNKAEFLQSVKEERKKTLSIKTGLTKYLDTIHSGEHTVFSPTFLERQTKSTNSALEEIQRLTTSLDILTQQVDKVQTSAAIQDAIMADGGGAEDYFGFWTELGIRLKGDDDRVTPEFIERFNELKCLITRIQKVVVANHVFYKVNYALAADKKS